MEIEENEQIESPNLDVEFDENQSEELETSHNDSLKNDFKETPNQRNRILRLPLARIKNMMKLDPDCSLTSQDSIFLVTKATEFFIEFLTKEAGKQLGLGKRKTVLKRDVDAAIENNPKLCFLDGALE